MEQNEIKNHHFYYKIKKALKGPLNIKNILCFICVYLVCDEICNL